MLFAAARKRTRRFVSLYTSRPSRRGSRNCAGRGHEQCTLTGESYTYLIIVGRANEYDRSIARNVVRPARSNFSGVRCERIITRHTRAWSDLKKMWVMVFQKNIAVS